MLHLSAIFDGVNCEKLRSHICPIILVLFLVSACSAADCQNTVSVVKFRVINSLSGSPVVLAHVMNKTRREAAIADLLGCFKIPIGIGDTISITSLGFTSKSLYSWGQYVDDSIYYTIRLTPRTYELKGVEFSWFSNYDKFLKGFLQLQLPVTKEEEQIARIAEYFKRSISSLNLMSLPQATSGGAFGKDWLAKQNEKLKAKLKQESQRRAIERKFSAGLVKTLTGLEGNEVFWFMEYCAFTDDYLQKATDYDIRLKVVDKFKLYKQDKSIKLIK